MSAHHAPDWVPHRSGTGMKNDGVFATWLGLIAFTFFLGTFLAANVYLRMWSPEQFAVAFKGAGANLPYITTLVLLLAGLILVIAGSAYRQGAYKRFQFMLVLATLTFTGYGVLQIKLMTYVHSLGAHAWTTHMTIYALMFALAGVCVFMIAKIGTLFSERNEKALKNWVPAAMSVFTYTVAMGVLSLIIMDVLSVGEFAEWCGTKLTQIVNK